MLYRLSYGPPCVECVPPARGVWSAAYAPEEREIERGQGDSNSHPSGRQPDALPDRAMASEVVHRRRGDDDGCCEQWESRFLLPERAPRRPTGTRLMLYCLLLSPNHHLSNSVVRQCDGCKTPRLHWAQAGRVRRSSCRAMAARYGVLHRCSHPAPGFVPRCPYSGSASILLCPSCDRERSRFAGMLSAARFAPIMVAARTTVAAAPPRGVLQLAPTSARPRSARGVRVVANRGSQLM